LIAGAKVDVFCKSANVLMNFFFNKKQEKCLVSHFEYFYKEKKVVFPSVRMVTLSGRHSDGIPSR